MGSGRMFMYKGVGWGRASCVGCVGWMRGEKPQVPGQVSTRHQTLVGLSSRYLYNPTEVPGVPGRGAEWRSLVAEVGVVAWEQGFQG